MDADERNLLEAAAGRRDMILNLVTGRAMYTCCGRGWHERVHPDQGYTGYISALSAEHLSLTSPGLGTISYVVAVRLEDVELLEVAP